MARTLSTRPAIRLLRRTLHSLSSGLLRPFATRYAEQVGREKAALQQEVDVLERRLVQLQDSVDALQEHLVKEPK